MGSTPGFFPPAVAELPGGDPRRRLLDAMIYTAAHKGYDRTTVSCVSATAEVPEELFAEHFTDKQDCFLQAVDELIAGAERAAMAHFARPAPWPERVRAALECLLQALARDPDGARVVFVEMLAAGPAAAERQRRVLALFTALVEEGRAGAPYPDCLAAETSEGIVGGIASILHRRVLQRETGSLPSLHADLTHFVLLPYRNPEQALDEARLRPAA